MRVRLARVRLLRVGPHHDAAAEHAPRATAEHAPCRARGSTRAARRGRPACGCRSGALRSRSRGRRGRTRRRARRGGRRGRCVRAGRRAPCARGEAAVALDPRLDVAQVEGLVALALEHDEPTAAPGRRRPRSPRRRSGDRRRGPRGPARRVRGLAPAATTTRGEAGARFARATGRHEHEVDRRRAHGAGRHRHHGAVLGERALEAAKGWSFGSASSPSGAGRAPARASAARPSTRSPPGSRGEESAGAKRPSTKTNALHAKTGTASSSTASLQPGRRAGRRGLEGDRGEARDVRVAPLLEIGARQPGVGEWRRRPPRAAPRANNPTSSRARAAACARKRSRAASSSLTGPSPLRPAAPFRASRSPSARARARAPCRRTARCGRRRARGHGPARCSRADAGSA